MMNKDEDQDWLDALAGKPNADSDPEVTRHANALRQAIKQHDAAHHSSEADMEAGLQKLKFRLRSEGLSSTDRRPFMNKRFVQFAVAASVVLTVGLMVRVYLHQSRAAYSLYRFDDRILVSTYYASHAVRRARGIGVIDVAVVIGVVEQDRARSGVEVLRRLSVEAL